MTVMNGISIRKHPVEIRTEGGDVRFTRLEVYPLKSIHTDKP